MHFFILLIELNWNSKYINSSFFSFISQIIYSPCHYSNTCFLVYQLSIIEKLCCIEMLKTFHLSFSFLMFKNTIQTIEKEIYISL